MYVGLIPKFTRVTANWKGSHRLCRLRASFSEFVKCIVQVSPCSEISESKFSSFCGFESLGGQSMMNSWTGGVYLVAKSLTSETAAHSNKENHLSEQSSDAYPKIPYLISFAKDCLHLKWISYFWVIYWTCVIYFDTSHFNWALGQRQRQ